MLTYYEQIALQANTSHLCCCESNSINTQFKGAVLVLNGCFKAAEIFLSFHKRKIFIKNADNFLGGIPSKNGAPKMGQARITVDPTTLLQIPLLH